MRRSDDFRRTVRHGVRVGRRTVVVHALRDRVGTTGSKGCTPGLESPATGAPEAYGIRSTGPVVGFVVSKAIGSAVRRNRVRRRLRHLTRPRLAGLPDDTSVVVRALPAAASAGIELGLDLDAAWTAALAKLAVRTVR